MPLRAPGKVQPRPHWLLPRRFVSFPEGNTQNLLQQRLHGSARNMANHGHIGHGGCQAWPEVAPHFQRYRRLGGLPATRADHVVHLIFADVGFDLRQFGNLMPPGFSFGHPGGCILGQGLVTVAALLGKHRHYPVDPLKRNQGPPVPRMPFLSSRFASLFSFPLPTAPRPLWSRQSVTGRRFGGVGGISPA